MKASKEYSLAELLEHPVLGMMMMIGGIERRSLDLILDAQRADRRRSETAFCNCDVALYPAHACGAVQR
jgi:hypothetical protein